MDHTATVLPDKIDRDLVETAVLSAPSFYYLPISSWAAPLRDLDAVRFSRVVASALIDFAASVSEQNLGDQLPARRDKCKHACHCSIKAQLSHEKVQCDVRAYDYGISAGWPISANPHLCRLV